LGRIVASETATLESPVQKILLLNGPNLNLLGIREPGRYGSHTLDAITKRLTALAQASGYELHGFQSNAEHALIDRVHQCLHDGTHFVIFNPGAFTHTSVALRDAFLGVKIPFVETHLSNVHAREAFRHHSYFSDIAVGVICGFGAQSYDLALHAAIHYLQQHNAN
jgi:3-dehydroquinate dehydratase II